MLERLLIHQVDTINILMKVLNQNIKKNHG